MKWFGEQVALPELASQITQDEHLLSRFDSLSDDLQSQITSERDDRSDDFEFLRIGLNLADEGTVDLERIKGQVVQMTQRRVTGPKVVHRDAHTERLQLA